MSSIFSRLHTESGLSALINSSRDIHLLCLQRFVRMFGYGSTALVLALFLSALGNSDRRIGAFMTATLLGDVIISFILTLFADGLGRRRILVVGSALMAISGLVFALFPGSYWLLVLASIVGVISPSGNEIGPFRAVEESTMAQLCDKNIRSDLFAWYTLIGMAGAAAGQIVCGLIVQILITKLGWTNVGAYRIIFGLYAALGIFKTVLSLMLTEKCEVVKKPAVISEPQGLERTTSRSQQPLLTDNDERNNDPDLEDRAESPPPSPPPQPKRNTFLTKLRSLLPSISPRSRITVLRLCSIFVIDNFASGLITTSWVSFFFTTKFGLAATTLGTIFSIASLIASISNLFAAALAKRIGLINTMVFTHLPSAIFLALIPSTSNLPLAATFLFLRSCTSSMDTAPRQAFLSMAVLSEERTAVMGVTNLVKTLGQSAGPSVTGYLAGAGKFWVAFVLAGALKATYDLSMLAMFSGFKPPEE